MGNAFRAGPDNEAPHGRDMTDEDRAMSQWRPQREARSEVCGRA